MHTERLLVLHRVLLLATQRYYTTNEDFRTPQSAACAMLLLTSGIEIIEHLRRFRLSITLLHSLLELGHLVL